MKALKGHPSSHIEVIAQHRMWASLLVFVFSMIASPALVSAEQNASLSPRAQTIFLAGTTDLKDGSFPAAVSAFKEFLKLDNRFAPAYLNLGLAYHSLKQYEKAIPAFKKALELDGQLQSAALFLGVDYCKINSPEEAVKPLEMALTLRPQDSDAHLWLGRALLAKGVYPEAIFHLQKAAEAYPQDLSLLYDLSRAHLLLSQQISERIYQNNPRSDWAHFLLGQAYQVEGKNDLAIIQFRQALQLNPRLRGAHAALGELYLKKQDFHDAEEEFKKEIEINPYSYRVVCQLADILIQTGRVDDTMPLLEKTAMTKPSLGCAHYELGRAWMRKVQFQKAVVHLEKAVALNPTYAPAYV